MSPEKRVNRARELRHDQSDAEAFVWRRLRNRRFANFKFRRQVSLGSYIVDFVCFDGRLVVELDGGQHNAPEQKEHDSRREGWLKSQGFRVLRFWNYTVFTEWSAIEEIVWRELQNAPSGSAGGDQQARD